MVNPEILTEIQGYTDLMPLHHTGQAELFRGRRISDDLPVLIKVPLTDSANQSLRVEYELLTRYRLPGLIGTVALDFLKGNLFTVLEDPGGVLLKTCISSNRLKQGAKFLSEFVDVALQIVNIVESLHDSGIIHKNINPCTFMIDPSSRSVKLVDMSIASIFPKENPQIQNPQIMEGNLAYISPEQTGRMNRPLDYRTDFYSLGVTLYEFLTGDVPFQHTDPLELIHSHLARAPKPPRDSNRDIPEVLSDMVLKLLAKTAEDRYHSTHGIKADLKACAGELATHGTILPFKLGSEDVPGTLCISSKLYGRDEERSLLLGLFDKASRGPMEFVMVAGYSGIGKTSLVQETYKPITAKRGYFVSGKFDRFHRNVPYSALSSAFQGLIQQILTESQSRLDLWRESLKSTLGENAQIVTDVIPDLELILGPQPPVKELGSLEAQNRFHRVFKRFIAVFCSSEHPLVVFLDDLQWVDMATLRLLEFLVSNDHIDHLFFIGAYRDNEIGPAHPLRAFIDGIGRGENGLHQIILTPLPIEHVTCMISELLSREPEEIGFLSETIMGKTFGNPFFINQFLTTLNQEEVLTFDPNEPGWVWDDAVVQEMSITENVVDLLIRRLKAMPDKTEEVLKIGACLGTRFDLDLLSLVTECDHREVFENLMPALREGLLVPVAYSRSLPSPNRPDNQLAAAYRFLHDRVHQAAYALISEPEKKSFHLGIGKVLLKILDEAQREEHIFDIVDHFNFAADCIETRRERDEVAALNLVAGHKALASAAFEPAYTYLKAGIGFLSPDSWEVGYGPALDLHTACLRAAYLCGHFAEVDDLFETVREKARTPLDQASAYKSRILALDAQNLLPQSIDCALDILSDLGEPISKNLSPDEIRRDFLNTADRLSRFNDTELINWPDMTDPVKLAVTGILDSMIAPAFIGLPELSPLVVSKLLQLTISHGHTPESPFSYTAFGGMLCKIGPDIETGYRFGRLAMTLADRFGSLEQKTKVLHSFTGYVDHWKRHLSETLEDAVKGYQTGLESGDFEFAGYNTYIHSKHSLYCGRPLRGAEREMTAYSEAVRQLKQELPLGFNNIFRQTAQNLLGRCENPTHLIGDAYDERVMLPRHHEANDRLGLFYYNVCRLMLCFFFEDYSKAVACSEAADIEIKRISAGPSDYPLNVFLGALARMAEARRHPEQQPQTAVETADHEAQLSLWAAHAPMNYQHKYHLVAAERAQLLGDNAKAFEHYDQALARVRESGYINEEALTLELTGKQFLRMGCREMAAHYLNRSRQCYLRWEAMGKVRHLEKNYPELLKRSSLETRAANIGITDTAADAPISSGQLDRATLMKASQAIAGELDLDRLLITLIRVAIENAGADIGVLVLESEGELRCAVRGTADGTETLLKPFTPVSEDGEISSAVVYYVARTRKKTVLSDPAELAAYANDAYLQAARPRSVLCAPILHQARLVGILYLENTHVPDAFPQDRLEVVELLASRIASAIENARLYYDLKQAEEKYRSIFENAVEGIFQSTPDGQFISANPSMARLLEYDSTEELIDSIADIGKELYLHKEDRDELIRQVRERSLVTGFETQFRRKSGLPLWVAINVRAVYSEDGVLDFIEGFVTDITERKRAMEDMQAREESLLKENLRLRSDIRDRYRFGAIVGKCAAMQEVYELIVKAAASEAPVIVYGESGTGKELVARAVHDISDRKRRPFVPVNCGALPENLLESEFFGYKKGAFTGATADRGGYLDQADGGTLFLDELGEIDTNLQVKLLRVLDGGGYSPVGSREVKKPNLRIIAATNRNLRGLVSQGEMREDFFYRVHVIPIHLPPLRERREDLPLLIDHFFAEHSSDSNPPAITGKMVDAMWRYHWPGNVRELMNVLHRYQSLNRFDLLGTETQPAAGDVDAALALKKAEGDYGSAMTSFEKGLLQRALEDHCWHREKTAQSLGVPLRTFFRKLQKHGLIRHD